MMPAFKDGSGIHVDFTSKTVVLIGIDMIDYVTGLVDGPIDVDLTQAIAFNVAKNRYPDMFAADDEGVGWSLGAEEHEIHYLLSKLGPGLGPVEFKSDGGLQHGAV